MTPRPLVELTGNTLLAAGIAVAGIMAFLTVNSLMLVWLERKLSARIQRRLGPTEAGPFGLLQTMADALKLISKQLVTPRDVDRVMYLAAPIMVFTPVLALVALIPWSQTWTIHDYDIGIVLLLAISGVNVIAIFTAGWGSNNKYALLGAVRAIAQNISYEIPLLLAIMPVILITRSLSLHEIASAQSTIPFVVYQPVAALIYLIAATAETNRAPFDLPEAESELVGGFHTEYSGMRFGVFFFAEYSHMVVVSALATTLFFGGWSGPFLPGALWFLAKVYLIVAVMMWVRWTFPRVRFDQLLSFAWLVLVPLAIANLIATAAVLRLAKGG